MGLPLGRPRDRWRLSVPLLALFALLRGASRARRRARDNEATQDLMPAPFPFSAIVGQDEMKLAVLIAAVEPAIGGLLVLGRPRHRQEHRGARRWPRCCPRCAPCDGCPYHCDPAATSRCEPLRTG